MLKNKAPGTFVVRDSNSFPGAFGLALKVAQPPAGVTPSNNEEKGIKII
jgi:tensin